MAVDGIYFGSNTITSSTAIQGKDASQLTMSDFMTLLTAQMSNQDMMNPVSETDFIAQMAQFTSLQAMQTLQEYQLSSYATSYVGKFVSIAHLNDLGALETVSGYVEGVNFYDGNPKVVVDGKSYDLFEVMEVSNAAGLGSLNEAAAYIGKTVTISYQDEDSEEAREVVGDVTAVTIKDNVPHVIVDGKEYPAGSIVSVAGEGDA